MVKFGRSISCSRTVFELASFHHGSFSKSNTPRETPHKPSKMTSIGAVTRQIAALEISSKPNTTRTTPALQKKPSQNAGNVSRLLTKFAAPNPFTTNHAKSNSVTSIPSKQVSRPPSPTKQPAPSSRSAHAQPSIDIGKYDGGFEIENETRGERVYGEAAEELALDSSVSRYAYLASESTNMTLNSFVTDTDPLVSGTSLTSTSVDHLERASSDVYTWFERNANRITSSL